MANENRKIKIASMDNVNEKFANITGIDGLKYGIGKDKAPKLYELACSSKTGDEIEGQYWGKEGKHYLFDISDKKGGIKPFAPKDKSFEAALVAVTKAGGSTQEEFKKSFEFIHGLIMSKATISINTEINK